MLSLLLSGDGTVVSSSTTRAQLPLLLNHLVVTTTYAIDLAEETDTAQDITVFMGAKIIQVDQAEETDVAQNITVINPPGVVFVPVDIASETDTAQDIVAYLSTSGSYPGVYPGSSTYPWSGAYFAIDIAEETDEAWSITVRQTWIRPHVDRDDILLTPAASVLELDLTPVVPV